MDIDKEKLKGLLWAEAASYRADCADWKRNTEALDDFLGEKTVGEVALELLAESDRLVSVCERAEQVINTESKAAAIATGRANLLQAERDQLRAEVAGLRTGYEAYERVNAELKDENEALKKRIDDMSPFKGAPLTGPDLKCLACGGYHYGLQGLPCPNMRITASAALGQGEQS